MEFHRTQEVARERLTLLFSDLFGRRPAPNSWLELDENDKVIEVKLNEKPPPKPFKEKYYVEEEVVPIPTVPPPVLDYLTESDRANAARTAALFAKLGLSTVGPTSRGSESVEDVKPTICSCDVCSDDIYSEDSEIFGNGYDIVVAIEDGPSSDVCEFEGLDEDQETDSSTDVPISGSELCSHPLNPPTSDSVVTESQSSWRELNIIFEDYLNGIHYSKSRRIPSRLVTNFNPLRLLVQLVIGAQCVSIRHAESDTLRITRWQPQFRPVHVRIEGPIVEALNDFFLNELRRFVRRRLQNR